MPRWRRLKIKPASPPEDFAPRHDSSQEQHAGEYCHVRPDAHRTRAAARRLRSRTIYRILDEGFVCHVGFTSDEQTFVIPTMFARVGDAIYFHGSVASRMLRGVGGGLNVCVTVTLTDGLVLARSVFNHSMNYRSVVALGTATIVDEPGEKLAALHAFTEKILPGRWNDARQPNEKNEGDKYSALPLTEVSGQGSRRRSRRRCRRLRVAGVGWNRAAAAGRRYSDRDERCDTSLPTPPYAMNFRSGGN